MKIIIMKQEIEKKNKNYNSISLIIDFRVSKIISIELNSVVLTGVAKRK